MHIRMRMNIALGFLNSNDHKTVDIVSIVYKSLTSQGKWNDSGLCLPYVH